MNYKFNPFTGRLNAPTPLEVPSKYGKYVEGPRLQFIEGTKIPITDTPAYRGKYAPVPDRLMSKMRQFQMPNGVPVHIKGGPIDKILYAVTAGVCLLGLIDCFRVYYSLSYPPAKTE